MENFDISTITDALGKVFGDLEGFGALLKSFVDAFLGLRDLFKDF